MKVGILFEGTPKKPGGFYQSLQSTLLLNEIKSNDFNFECITLEKDAYNFLKNKIKTKIFKQNFLFKIFNFLTNSVFFSNLIVKYNIKHPFTSFIEKNKYDLIIFISPHSLSFFCGKTNFIFNIWDIDHKKNAPYPEHRINYNYRKREDLIDYILFHSFKIIVPDNKIEKELKELYNYDNKKLIVQNFIPYIPRFHNENKNINYNEIFKKFNIYNKKIILYPATFWPHKNHNYLIDVAKIFKENKKKDYIFVLCGSDKGIVNKIKNDIVKFKLDEYFKIFEFVDDKELISLYLNSSMVVMTTDGGPTNLPMFESFYFEKPLFYSDHLLDKNDKLNQFFIGINIRNPQDFYDKLYNLNDDYLMNMVSNAKKFYNQECSNDKFKENYTKIINEFLEIKKW